MCRHFPTCPSADATDRDAAAVEKKLIRRGGSVDKDNERGEILRLRLQNDSVWRMEGSAGADSQNDGLCASRLTCRPALARSGLDVT